MKFYKLSGHLTLWTHFSVYKQKCNNAESACLAKAHLESTNKSAYMFTCLLICPFVYLVIYSLDSL